MRLNLSYAIICIFFGFAINILLTGKVISNDEPFPSFNLPVMDGNYNYTKASDKSRSLKSISYLLRTGYPANQVLEFYESKLTKLGYISSIKKYKRKWECFIDGTIDGGPKVRQLLALWVNPKLNVEAFLALRYIKVEKKWTDELHVSFQIQPSIQTKALEIFFSKLAESNKTAEFMRLIGSYRKSNGEVDIEKAINENPNDELLKEYERIIEDMK